MAKHMIEKGHIRTAIIGGSNLVQRPNLSLQLTGLGVLTDGTETRSFSEDGTYTSILYRFFILSKYGSVMTAQVLLVNYIFFIL